MQSPKHPTISPKVDTFQEECEDGAVENTIIPDQLTQDELLYQQVFGVPLILKEILKYLHFPDLLTTSMVNQSWNFFSREILREMNCIAVIDSGNSCDSLKRFNQLLKNTGNVPFNGLSVALSSFDDDGPKTVHCCVQYDKLSELSCHVMSKICVKYLQIYNDTGDSCVAVDLILKILGACAETLEEFSLEAFPYEYDNFATCMGLKVKGAWLPNVRIFEFEPTLNLHDRPEFDTIPCSIIQEIVQAAPNLREIRGYIHSYQLEPLLKMKKIPVIADFHYRPSRKTSEVGTSVREFAFSNPMLEKFCFSTQVEDFMEEIQEAFSKWSKIDHDDVAQNVTRILHSSVARLRRLEMDQLGLILMMTQWNIPVMEQVHYLNIWYSPYFEKDCNLPVLSKLDWSKSFPNLKNVCVINYLFEQDIDVQFYLNENFRLSTSQFCCKTVSEFTLEGYDDQEDWNPDRLDLKQMKAFRNIFPNVKRFFGIRTKQFKELMTLLWELWPNLEVLKVSVLTETPFHNFDSIMTGLSPAETGYVYENFEDAKSLEVAAVKPCLLNLPKLEILGLSLFHPNITCEKIHSTSDLVFLSRVTAQCAFARLPKLAVTIERETCKEKTKCNLALNHLKPFAKVLDLK